MHTLLRSFASADLAFSGRAGVMPRCCKSALRLCVVGRRVVRGIERPRPLPPVWPGLDVLPAALRADQLQAHIRNRVIVRPAIHVDDSLALAGVAGRIDGAGSIRPGVNGATCTGPSTSTARRSTPAHRQTRSGSGQALLPQDAEERAPARTRSDRHGRGRSLPAGHHSRPERRALTGGTAALRHQAPAAGDRERSFTWACSRSRVRFRGSWELSGRGFGSKV